MMFSATFPRQIQRLAADFLLNPVEIKVRPQGKAGMGFSCALVHCLFYL